MTGAGLPELASRRSTSWRKRCPTADPGAPVRLWIDRAFSMTGSGTVVTGTLPAGTVHRATSLSLTPSMRPVRVREIQSLGEPVAGRDRDGQGRAEPARREQGLVHRGMALVQAGRWTLTDLIDVRLQHCAGSWRDGGKLARLASQARPGGAAADAAADCPPARRLRPGVAARVIGPTSSGSAWPIRCRCMWATGCCCATRAAARTGGWPAGGRARTPRP